MKKLVIVGTLVAAALLALIAQPSRAAVSADEAKQLGSTLTEFGAEKAGNSDGSIPAYTGGIDKLAGYDPKTSPRYVDPFASDKPLYAVDVKTMAQHADMLTEGTKALMRAHPDYKIDVYPPHRSVRYVPWVLQNTLKNATTAKLGGEIEGDAVTGADNGNLPFAGIPFPIPKNGYEVMWNYKMHFAPAVRHDIASAYLVDTSGRVSALPGTNEYFVSPWYDVKNKMRSQTFDSYLGFSAMLTDPPSSAGIVFLNFYLPSAESGGQKVWFYTPGQRRVRMAPEFSYDVPIASYGGVIVWDEIFGFVGRMDRFDFKLAGKKEMIVPYNVYGISNTMPNNDDYLGPKFVKAGIRFEKHRVWVVDATRKASARHAYSRRTFYIDEDSWAMVASESYDNAGKVWRVTHIAGFPTYDVGGINGDGWVTYDLIKGNYFVVNVGMGEPNKGTHSYDTAEGLKINLTPGAVASAGVR